ncbi:gdp-man:man c-pp-dol alpha--mannosyltransferase [Phytophthora cinnamomi]|uniref:gdp-man:man c-pp-dol alpha--mannosyltransferase n=1 Tax=Phytophthora cinnamomi TaxID=4785 RepID=UPI00355976E5|nr:gdp-man:man c-pp-dol alpha--mannosyltransferase [Phytophthora cinnamomi]
MNIALALLSLPPLLVVVAALLLVGTRLDYKRHQRLVFSKAKDTPVCIGVFHPYANGGGGGERVLYGALIALVEYFTRRTKKGSSDTEYALQLILYTGDDGLTAPQLIHRAAIHFNLPELLEYRVDKFVTLVTLHGRDLLEPNRYPSFTLLWQAIAQFRLGLEAFAESRKRGIYPQFWLETLGCPFSYLVARIGFGCTVMSYTHYPMISVDMIDRVQRRESSITNQAAITTSASRSRIKYVYYRLFAAVYGAVGRCCTTVSMVNSTWTHDHVKKLWGNAPIVVYPGCGSIQDYMKFSLENRDLVAISISQFRPEKNHMLQLEAVKVLFDEHSDKMVSKFGEFKLVIIGSCPTKESEKLVATLQAEARNLGVQDHVEFLVNASYADMKPYMERASIGIHTMSNEHFGISNVEIMAAGIIHIANDSAGPKYDIVKPGTGYLASTAREYAARMWQVLNQSPAELVKIRQAARESTRRFSDEHFKRNFIAAIEVGLRKKLG